MGLFRGNQIDVMKKKKNKTGQRKRYYDYRLVVLFVALFLVCFALSYLKSRTLQAPLLTDWKAFWDGGTALQYALLSFDVFLAWVAAGYLCTDDKAAAKKDSEAEKDYSSDLWTAALTGLPLCINCVSDLSIWAYYSVFMLVTAGLIGKYIGFAYPVGKSQLKSVYNELADITVRTRMGAEYRFHRHSGFWISCFVLLLLFILTVVFFIKAYNRV